MIFVKNIIYYYYGVFPNELILKNNIYFFIYNNTKYAFEKVKKPIVDIDALYNLNRSMINNNILVHEIILNKENSPITNINNNYYVLMEIHINSNLRISLHDICYINNSTLYIKCNSILNRYDWTSLWEQKNDYFESQINEIGNNFPILSSYLNYYIGLSENAIMYIKSVIKLNDISTFCINHRRIDSNSNLFYLYHPLSFIYDYKVRDISEYIKSSFFNNENVYDIITEYFKNNYVSYKDAMLFYGRMLYPSYFFDMYDEIINNNLSESKVNMIINKSTEYERLLIKINTFLSNIYGKTIPRVDWLVE